MNSSDFRAKARAMLGNNIFGNDWLLALVVGLIYSAIIGLASSIGIGVGAIIVSGPLAFGLAGVFLNKARGQSDIKIEGLFNGFTTDFGGNLVTGLLISIFVSLWSLLFVIPGFIKAYSYAMAFYIKNDNPALSAAECITESRKLMDGNKWRLFCLDLSFIGWYIVGSFCLGIGTLWVTPYHQAARACFYAEISANKE